MRKALACLKSERRYSGVQRCVFFRADDSPLTGASGRRHVTMEGRPLGPDARQMENHNAELAEGMIR
jgi:hypothetical protein